MYFLSKISCGTLQKKVIILGESFPVEGYNCPPAAIIVSEGDGDDDDGGYDYAPAA